MSDKNRRDHKVIATVACPICGARVGEPCRQRKLDGTRWNIGPRRSHSDRRTAWRMVRDGEVQQCRP